MAPLTEVALQSLDPARFEAVYREGFKQLAAEVERAREIMAGLQIWNFSSTARGGGVAEMLHTHLGYIRGAGIDVHWLILNGTPRFYEITKRIHNNIHGSEGDGGPLGEAERRDYEAVIADNVAEVRPLIAPGDVVFCHDPQTAGMIPAMGDAGARVVWRCHVGTDDPNGEVDRAREFLRPYVEQADAYTFSRKEFIWPGLDASQIWIIPPTIDAFSPKNQDLDPRTARAILYVAGLSDTDRGGEPVFLHADGTPQRVNRQATRSEDAVLPADVPVVAQVSRWDHLKDPMGVLRCFAEHVDAPEAHLVLAGADVSAVRDDPEGAAVLAEVTAAREELPAEVRARVHLVSLPMNDLLENAAIVNALQRRATVIVQKSIAEAFGLTIAEAMWKARPVVASRRGGIQDQIVDGESGILIDDPHDLAAAGAAITRLLHDPALAERIGAAARQRVAENFLALRRLIDYFQGLEALDMLIPRSAAEPAGRPS